MDEFGTPSRPSLFSRTLRDCRELYVSSGELCEREYPHLLDRKDGKFVALMDDLHRALVLKIYLSICEADRKWSKQERFLAEVLCHHLWGEWLSGKKLNETMRRASTESTKLTWYSMVRPFDRIPPLRERVGKLDSIVARLSNIVARADGTMKPPEAAVVRSIQLELDSHLKQRTYDGSSETREEDRSGTQAVEELRRSADDGIYVNPPSHQSDSRDFKKRKTTPAEKVELAKPQEPELTVEEALAELDKLIGLDEIKHEVRSLTNFLKLQQRRTAAGLPETDIALHMVFTGNPGTGKTTVARIIGKIYRALGVLEKGHLIETDRSGLVAEYAGQTGPKTNKKVDESIGGILFIDEAYSLVANGSEDPYGHEAVQALLKRAEDDRKQLVVILAGYPDEMQELLESNPGLSSRFNRKLHFVDYKPAELAAIFGLFCRKNHYKLTPEARLKVIQWVTWHYDVRDKHFGNGRASRNLFEQAIRNMANRLSTLTEISEEQLQLLEASDISYGNVPEEVYVDINDPACRVQIHCDKCQHDKDVPAKFLGQKVVCPKCKEQFQVEWGSLVCGDD
ncbi:AAA family ATPase [Aeoliella mucimassa]|uniref:Stage V sporulation protein K n=1 Tax=Aeoliella mucimassa TaxID=2527972 RepID=A0A518AM50_9BACT|nr:AAA family ATPase [Aeoliella mucimassa]QDU55799.1 Stage V sporulation protein K [Aeoliella mucimassa]